MTTIYRLLSGLLLAAVFMAVVACGGTETVVEKVVETVIVTEKGDTVVERVVETVIVTEKGDTVEKIVEVTPTSVPTGFSDIPRSKTLIMAGLGGEHPGAFTDVENFNPHAGGISRSGLYQAATEGLFYYNMLTGETIPWLATDFEYDAGFTGVTVNLRAGVEWSDGTPFTADDVAFTLNMLNENDKMSRHGEVALWTEKAEAVDDLTVHVTFKTPAPRYMWDILTFRADVGVPMTPKHIFEAQDDPSSFTNYDPAKGWPVVTGPYKLVFTNVEKKLWDRRDDWWAAKTGFHDLPDVERLIFLPGMNEITMAQLLITNEIDMAFSLTVPNYKAVVGQNEKITTHYKGEPPYGYLDWWPVGLGLNTKRAPFDNIDVRWAISYSIDRDEVIEFGFAGGQVAPPLMFPEYEPMKKYFAAAEDLLVKYPTLENNPEKVVQLMTKSGFAKDGDGFWSKGGERLSFTIVTFPQHPSTTPAAPVVTAQLRRNGFDAKFVLPTDFVTRIISGEADAFIWGHASMRDPVQMMDAYSCRFVPDSDLEDVSYPGLYRWCNEDYTALVDKMKAMPVDDPALMPLFEEAIEIWLREMPDIALNSTIITLPMNETYWTNWPQFDNQYIHEGFWHRTALQIFLNLESVQ
jgi:peptide/nickel transport system substrate-binding protein